MNLSIKLYDNIWVTTHISSITLSQNYAEARNSVRKIFYPNQVNDLIFSEFFAEISSVFNPSFSYNLYYMVNADDITKVIKKGYSKKNAGVRRAETNQTETSNKIINFLNYFGFDINSYPTQEQLAVLKSLKERLIIEYYWVEGIAYPESNIAKLNFDVNQPLDFNHEQNIVRVGTDLSENSSNSIIENQFIQDLAMNSKKNRGLGAKIIILEKYATDRIERLSKNKNLNKKFKKNGVVISINNENNGFIRTDNQIIHQIKTLLTLFASADNTNPNNGIVPEADVVLGGLNIADNTQNIMGVTMAELRRLLFKVNNSEFKNSILLFEFVMDVPVSESGMETHAVIVIPDILEIISSMTNHENIIVVGGAGNNSTSYDELVNGIWTLEGFNYTDLSKNIPSFIMIGASVFDEEKNSYVIDQVSNQSKNFDAYLYTDFFVGFPEDDNIFKGTSAAGAVAAGIITYLQANAIQKNRKKVRTSIRNQPPLITTKIIKQIFKQNFMKNFPLHALTPTTLQKLWTDTQRRMRLNP